MILLSLLGLWLILMLAIVLWPIPDFANLDLSAYRRAGDRFSGIMLGLFFASMIVVVIAKVYLEVHRDQWDGTTPVVSAAP